jgi:hypothetical protein
MKYLITEIFILTLRPAFQINTNVYLVQRIFCVSKVQNYQPQISLKDSCYSLKRATCFGLMNHYRPLVTVFNAGLYISLVVIAALGSVVVVR